MPTENQTVYDRLHNANPRNVANAAMGVLNVLQNSPPDEQLAAAAVLLLTLTRRHRIAPSTALNCVDNIIRYSRRYDDATFKGIYDYYANET